MPVLFHRSRYVSSKLDSEVRRWISGCQVTLTAGWRSGAAGVIPARQRPRYFAGARLTYFSRLMCFIGRPKPFSASTQASTMFGLPHR